VARSHSIWDGVPRVEWAGGMNSILELNPIGTS
jgi:hypothetical protein